MTQEEKVTQLLSQLNGKIAARMAGEGYKRIESFIYPTLAEHFGLEEDCDHSEISELCGELYHGGKLSPAVMEIIKTYCTGEIFPNEETGLAELQALVFGELISAEELRDFLIQAGHIEEISDTDLAIVGLFLHEEQ